MIGKVCRDCLRVKPVDCFYKRGNGLTSYCKPCHCARGRATRAKRPEHYRAYRNPNETPENRRNRLLKTRYGITSEEYEAILEEQGRGCAVCGATKTRRHLAVDHCHSTGEVRGILCDDCNLAIGKAGDDPERLRAMANYLETYFTKEIIHNDG